MAELLAQYRQDKDAFGHMVFDYFSSQEAIEIIEREDGYIGTSLGCRAYFAEFADWPAHQQEAMQYLAPGRSLDIGCGAGRVCLHLQSQGCAVIGVDVSPLAVEVCRRRGVQDARLLSITRVGPSLGTFDNILMLGNNWGLMGSAKRARWLLRRFHAITTPGARIIAESNDIYPTDNPIHLAYQAYNRQRGRMSGQIRMRSLYLIYRSVWFDYLMVSREEMQQILSGSGWRVDRFIDSTGASYIAIIVKE